MLSNFQKNLVNRLFRLTSTAPLLALTLVVIDRGCISALVLNVYFPLLLDLKLALVFVGPPQGATRGRGWAYYREHRSIPMEKEGIVLMIKTVKVHDFVSGKDTAPGKKVLVDRLWPRGVKKEDLPGHWLKDVAPSPELRKWFDHDEKKFSEFAERYQSELAESEAAGNEDVAKLVQMVDDGDVSLMFAAKDREINHAVVLKEWLEAR